MKESDYAVKAAAWRMLDYANLAWRPVDFSGSGKNMQCNYPMKRNSAGEVIEFAEEYWERIRHELWIKRLNA